MPVSTGVSENGGVTLALMPFVPLVQEEKVLNKTILSQYITMSNAHLSVIGYELWTSTAFESQQTQLQSV